MPQPEFFIVVQLNIDALFLYSCPDCTRCPANAIQIGQATWAIWGAIKKIQLHNAHGHVTLVVMHVAIIDEQSFIFNCM